MICNKCGQHYNIINCEDCNKKTKELIKSLNNERMLCESCIEI